MGFADEINVGVPGREDAGNDLQMSTMLLLFRQILRVSDP